MATYRMDDGTVVKAANATAHWDESRTWDGRNYISDATGSEWEHETLYRSRRGRYWISRESQWQGVLPRARWVDRASAAAWLLHCGYELPADLTDLEESVSE